MSPININGNVLDPADPHQSGLPQDASETKFVVLQCSRRPSIEEYDETQKLGIQILSVEAETPDHTSYLCKYDKDDLKALEALDFVQHALVYVSEFVMELSLKRSISSPEGTSAEATSDIPVTISLHDTTSETGHDLLEEIKRLGSAELIDADNDQLRVRMAPSSLSHVANLDYVKTIERTKVIESRTAVAHEILGAGALMPTKPTLRGTGEVIAVADQGLDTGKKFDIHLAFKDANGASRVKAILDYTRDPNTPLSDSTGHGTHVAACAVGSLQEDLGELAEACNVNIVKAPASDADLVFQVIRTGTFAPDLNKLFDVAGSPYYAKIHNNSWGTRTFDNVQEHYTSAESKLIDLAMVKDRELLIVWAAGNDGHKLSKYDIGRGHFSAQSFVRQIGAEAAAKNIITVGATINRRRITNTTFGQCYCVDGEPDLRTKTKIYDEGELWLRSSKGPTCEFRLKPDVVAPGVGILSARTRQLPKAGGAMTDEERQTAADILHQGDGKTLDTYKGEGKTPTRSFRFMSGTSQAAPLVSGCAAVLRQALKTKPSNPIENPSGALIKSLLVNGARDLAGRSFQAPSVLDGVPTTFVMPPSPNTAQGFGEVNLESSLKSLYPAISGEGSAADHPPMKQGQVMTVDVPVPAGKKNLRVTMAYNDKAGVPIADILNLTLVCQKNGTTAWTNLTKPDPIVYLPWQRNPASKGQPPNPDPREPIYSIAFTHNNVQRITCSVVGVSKVRLFVTATAITPPNGTSSGHAYCWLFY